jgi:uracil-DNA glycosylase
VTSLEEVALAVAGCVACPLAKTRLKTVPGDGPATADIMFIGEAPGYHENQQGRPFVGPAGQLLDELLASIGLKRPDVFIANVVKCRPPANRDPQPEEIAACSEYLDAQIAIIKPKVIVTLGRYSMARFFPGESISKIHGVARQHGGITCFAMYHPAAALHQPTLRQTLFRDMAKLPEIVAKAKAAAAPAEQQAPPDKPEQLSLF